MVSIPILYFTPKTEIFAAWIGISSRICQKISNPHNLQNCSSDWHKIWNADVTYHRGFVGGLIWTYNNSNMADGRHLEFRFWAISWASINIFALNLVQWWKINSPEATHWSEIRFSKIQDGGQPSSWILKNYCESAADWDIGTKFCVVVEINNGKSAVCQNSHRK